MENILIAGGIIDFYVNKEKYESYKTERGKWNYVYKTLNKYLEFMKGKIVMINGNEIKLRDVSITSNNFWGQDKFCIINDLNYSGSNQVPLNEDKLTIRILHIDVIGTSQCDEAINHFFTFETKKFYYQTSNTKLI